MIRQVKILNRDYLIVDTNIQIFENDDSIDVPIRIQVNITKIDPKKHYIIYSKVRSLFNRTITFKQPHIKKHPWWKFWSK